MSLAPFEVLNLCVPMQPYEDKYDKTSKIEYKSESLSECVYSLGNFSYECDFLHIIDNTYNEGLCQPAITSSSN